MRKFTKVYEAKESLKIDVQPDALNYLSVDDLDKYLAVAGKFISPEAKDVINWLKVNNESYLHDLDPKAKYDNALAGFYSAGVPKDEKLKELYKLVGKIVKNGLTLEIPVFQTEDQFNAIVNKQVSPDEILIGDISSTDDGLPLNKNNHLTAKAEANRERLFKKYQPLIYKVVNQFHGKSTLPYEDLYGAACEGFVNAMNTFGHPKQRDENGKWVEVEKSDKHVNYTFGQYAAYMIRNCILGAVENSHLVRISKSEQKRQREELGHNIKNNTISGNKTVGHDNEGNGKTVFDYIENSENGGKSIDTEDLHKLWKGVYAELEKKFGKEDMELFYRNYRINGYDDEKIAQKDLAKEYGLKPTTANVRINKILKYIRTNKILLDMFSDILELTHECKQNEYREEDQFNEVALLSKNITVDNNE